jgi:hypothetical protein
MEPQLLDGHPSIVSLGIETLEDGPQSHGGQVTHVAWQPAGDASSEIAWTVASLMGDRGAPDSPGSHIDAANQETIRRLVSSQPDLVDVVPHALDVWPELGRTLLHAGPPISWTDMCGPMRGAVIGALLYERWASSPEEALRLVDRGEIAFDTCHSHGAVGPMCGIISPSMPLFAVRNETHGNVAYSPLSEGSNTKSLRFGAYNKEVIEHLRWVEKVLAPVLKDALTQIDKGVDLKQIMAHALHMGDDLHNRTGAATLVFFSQLARAFAALPALEPRHLEVLEFVRTSDIFFLNLSMAASKATMDAAHGVPGSSLVTAMARNGVDVGIRVGGTGDRWFTAPADIPVGLYLPGFTEADANPDIGDSAISESAGLGAFAMAAAPAIVQFVGGTPSDALRYSTEMAAICAARHPGFTLPALDFVGAPLGIDIRKVVDENVRPLIDTAIGHREPGGGMVGAGIVRVPMKCFVEALQALARTTGAP